MKLNWMKDEEDHKWWDCPECEQMNPEDEIYCDCGYQRDDDE